MRRILFAVEAALFLASIAIIPIGLLSAVYFWNVLYIILSYSGVAAIYVIKMKNRQAAFIEAWVSHSSSVMIVDNEILSKLEHYKKGEDYYDLIKTINGLN